MRSRFRRASRNQDIYLFNNGNYEKEEIVGEPLLRLIYENPVGRSSLLFLVRRKFVSQLYGAYCKTRFSARHATRQIEKYGIDMTGCKTDFASYAEFFSRERINVRFPDDPNTVGSPCECAASVETGLNIENLIAAKGYHYSLEDLVCDRELASKYKDGAMLRLRLSPNDYHRIHFFDNGPVLSERFIKGSLFSVNPIAVSNILRLYCRNKRAYFIQRTEHFGDVLFVEVGATMVGAIVHDFKVGNNALRGDTAGYFLPGGSLVLLFFEPGKYTPCDTLLSQSLSGFESKVVLGQPL